ncbi:unnamed protein product, partial [Staurois parvus]
MISVAPSVPPVSVHQRHLLVPINATCQCHINAICHLSVHINATYQCPSELPFSANYHCQSVPPISVLPTSATYQ